MEEIFEDTSELRPTLDADGVICTVSQPELSDWKCHCFGGDTYGVVWQPVRGEEPNWFWRKMQYLCFGNKWVNK